MKKYQEIITIFSSLNVGESSQHFADTYIDIAEAYYELGQYQSAEQYCRKALEIYNVNFTINHIKVADAYFKFGEIYYELDDKGKILRSIDSNLN